MSLFSIQFILFIAALMILYYLAPKKYQWVVLLIASLFFYYVGGSWQTLSFVLLTTISIFFGAQIIANIQNDANGQLKEIDKGDKEKRNAIKKKTTSKKRVVLFIVVLINLGFLGVLKYGNFFVGIWNSIVSSNRIGYIDVLLPLGISFYTLQALGYLIDVYRNKYSSEKNILKLLLYVSYFPQIIQGPIGRYNKLINQFNEAHMFDEMEFRKSFLRILWGYVKKVVVSGITTPLVSNIFNNWMLEGYRGITIFIGIILYMIQIYADFSGGIDIVSGVSQMFGITLDENFRQPYLATSVSEFWQRWHITLGNWMRDYVFYPISLSKPMSRITKSLRKVIGPYYGKILPTFISSFFVFMLVGLWHGPNMKYVFYGLYNAILVASGALFKRTYDKTREILHIDDKKIGFRLFQMIRTLMIVAIGRYFVCADSVRSAKQLILLTIRNWNPWILFDGSLFKLGTDWPTIVLLILMVIVMIIVDVLNEKGIYLREVFARQGVVFRWLVYLFAILFVLIFGAYGPGFDISSFIYQGF